MDQKRCYGCMKMRSAQGYICEHCGHDERNGNLPDQLPIGTVLQNQYILGKVLGQGGFGITYMGWDIYLNTPVAIKEFFPKGLVTRAYPGSPQVAVIAEAEEHWISKSRDKFLQEARTLAQFSDEREIVHVRNVFHANGTAYIVMEYVRGITLKQHVRNRGGRITAQETLEIMKPIMRALDRIHEAGVIHRDISPDNIMLLPDGRAKLLDFGAARVVDGAFSGSRVRSTMPVVKNGFAPVEQYSVDGKQGPFTDVHALCATMYFCMTGQIPVDALTRLQSNQYMDWRIIPGLTVNQINALETGMALQAHNRIATVRELYERLFGPDIQPEPVPLKPPEPYPPKPPVPAPKPFPWKTAAAVAAVIVLLLLLPKLIESKDDPGQNTGETRDPTMEVEVTTSSEAVETAPPTQPLIPETTAPAETEPDSVPSMILHDAWKENVLAMQNESHTPDGEADSIAFGTGVQRKNIRTVTCLNYLNNAPLDAVDVSRNKDRSVLAWVVPNGDMYDLYIGADGGINAGTDCKGLFAFFVNVESINLGTAFHTDNTESMRCMFLNCSSLKELDVSNLNTENATHMGSMFSGCLSLQKLDLSTFKTGNVTDMGWIFSGCSSLTDVRLNSFDTSKVTHMGGMFYNCTSLEKLDLSGFDTGNVVTMTNMFYNCCKLVSIQAQHFNTAKVKGMDKMFRYCPVFRAEEVADWDFSNVVWYGDFMDPDKTVNGQSWYQLFQ